MAVGVDGAHGVAVLLAVERVSKWEKGNVIILKQRMEADIVGLMGQKEGKQKIVPQILVQVCTESKVVVSRAVFIITLSSKYELCSLIKWKVDGNWGQWTTWSSCSVTCGNANQVRSRQCNNPAPQYGGKDCNYDGSTNTMTKSCQLAPCPGKNLYRNWIELKVSYIA